MLEALRTRIPRYKVPTHIFLYHDDQDVRGFLLREKQAGEKWEEFNEELDLLP